MPRATNTKNSKIRAQTALVEQALNRLKALQPTAGQITPAPPEDDMPIGISAPDDPHGYGPPIFIRLGKLENHTPKEIIEEFGLEFFNTEIKPLLRR